MEQRTTSKTFKELNAEYEKLFAGMNTRRIHKRLRECLSCEDYSSPLNSFKTALETCANSVIVTFKCPLTDEKINDYIPKMAIFEDKLLDQKFNFLKLNIFELYNTYSPEMGYFIWDDYPDTNDGKLLKAVDDWESKYGDNITVILFQYNPDL